MGRPKGSRNKVSNSGNPYYKRVPLNTRDENIHCYGKHITPKQRMIRKSVREIIVNATSIALGVLIALLLWDGIWYLISK